MYGNSLSSRFQNLIGHNTIFLFFGAQIKSIECVSNECDVFDVQWNVIDAT